MENFVWINVLVIAFVSSASAAKFRCENIFESISENPVFAVRQRPEALIPHGEIQISDLENGIRDGIEIGKSNNAKLFERLQEIRVYYIVTSMFKRIFSVQ